MTCAREMGKVINVWHRGLHGGRSILPQATLRVPKRLPINAITFALVLVLVLVFVLVLYLCLYLCKVELMLVRGGYGKMCGMVMRKSGVGRCVTMRKARKFYPKISVG